MKIIQGDSLEVLKTLPDNSVDSIVSDPPYGISFMGKKWDYDVPSVEVWKETLRVLKPGGHALIACGTRTQHRMAVNLEDAGFEIRDIVAWVYGSGFPKSLNIGKAVDKMEGVEHPKNTPISENGSMSGANYTRNKMDVQSELGKKYEGWGTALKPAMELWTLCRKPLEEKTVAKNVLKYGTGGINIDECRVGTEEMVNQSASSIYSQGEKKMEKQAPTVAQGRFPANFIHDGSEEVVGLFPYTKGGKMTPEHTRHTDGSPNGIYGKFDTNHLLSKTIDDSGSASRFFYCAKSSRNERNKGLDSIVLIEIEYSICIGENQKQEQKVKLLVDMDTSREGVIDGCGIESKNATEWNTALFGNCTMEKFQEAIKSTTETRISSTMKSQIWNWLIHLLTNDYIVDVNYETASGSSLVENARESFVLTTIINDQMVSALGVKNVVSGTPLKISVKDGSNFHSTVKPVKLMQYLCRLITPKGGTILDPYMGSGTTGIGAKLEGFDFIGIEREENYVKIAEARINAY